jgi:hypothetical protein
MTKWIGAAALAITLMLNGSGTIDSAAAAPRQAAVQNHRWKATDFSARHRTRHHARYGYRAYDRPYYPAYIDRPYYYAPAPFVPFNFGYPLLPGPWW